MRWCYNNFYVLYTVYTLQSSSTSAGGGWCRYATPIQHYCFIVCAGILFGKVKHSNFSKHKVSHKYVSAFWLTIQISGRHSFE